MDYAALEQENKHFFNELRFNKGLFVNFLDTMAKYHKYPLQQQVNLFFHTDKTTSPLVASAAMWELLGTVVKSDANGIPVIDKNQPQNLTYVYDFANTVNFSEETKNKLLWKYDDVHHQEFVKNILSRDEEADTLKTVKNYCIREAARRYMGSGVSPSIIGTATAYVVLSRMGYDTKQLMKKDLLIMPYADVNAEETLQEINKLSSEILNPLGIRIKEASVTSNKELSKDDEADLLVEETENHVQIEHDFEKENSIESEPVTEEPKSNGMKEETIDAADEESASTGATDYTSYFEGIDLNANMSSVSGKRQVFQRNLACIMLAKKLKEENRYANQKEKELLLTYAGWGGMPEAFDANNTSWSKEFNLLHGVLTEKEYTAVRASTLNSHYTPNEIIQSIYDGLRHMGFEGKRSNILEPSLGSGRFITNMPEEIRFNSNIVGIELDPVTALISNRCLTVLADNAPSIKVINKGFETSNFANESFDLAISNVPFGDYKIKADPNFSSMNLNIHDYFIAKMLDQVRPGGFVVALTTKGTMDKQSSKFRKYLSERAELVTAIRLPDTAFAAAGTEAVTDLLILKKNTDGIHVNAFDNLSWNENWIDTNKCLFNSDVTDDRINHYFRQNKEHVLGEFTAKTSPHGKVITVTSNKSISEIAKDIHDLLCTNEFENIYTPADTPIILPEEAEVKKNHPSGFYIENSDVVFYDTSGNTVALSEAEKAEKSRIIAAINIRESLYKVLEAQRNSCSNEKLGELQRKLSSTYNNYAASYGRIFKDKTLNKVFSADYSYPMLLSLEITDEDNKYFVDQAPVFTERIISPHIVPEHVNSAEEALMVSIQEKGKIDTSFMSKISGMDYASVLKELTTSGSIFFDYKQGKYVLAEEYLSGDVRQKISDVQDKINEADAKINQIINSNLFEKYCDIPAIPEPQNELEKRIFQAYKEHKICLPENKEERNEFLKYASDICSKDKDRFAIYCITVNGNRNCFTDNDVPNDLGVHLYKYARNEREFNRMYYYQNVYSTFYDTVNRYNPHVQLSPYTTDDNKTFSASYRADVAETVAFADYISTKNQEQINQVSKDAAEYGKSSRFQEINQDEEAINFRKKIEIRRADFIRESLTKETDNVIIEELKYLERRKKDLQNNLEALEAVKPQDLLPSEINVNLGVPWLSPKLIKQFIADTLKVDSYTAEYELKVYYSEMTNEWKIDGSKDYNNPLAETTYGTEKINAYKLCELALNMKFPHIYDTVFMSDGTEKKVINQKATLEARLKQEDLKKAFKEWLWADEQRAENIAGFYNRHFNNIVPRQYKGEHLIFPNIASGITLEQHQKEAIAHSLFGGNTLFAHAVGAGKTFEIAASIMESHRLGLSHKAMIIVPKHLTGQFGGEFLRIYPNAKILVATPSDFIKENRQKFLAKIATQKWDAIVMSYNQFEQIPLSEKCQKKFLEEALNELELTIEEAKNQGTENWSIKRIEAQRKKLEVKIKTIETHIDKGKTNMICFEDLGIDKLAIDEAHYFKNLYLYTKMSNIAGVQTSTANKTEDLYLKTKYLNHITNNKALIFATGTPISNSMTELYTMQRYLQPDRLKEMRLASFDSWAANFGETVVSMELKPEGVGYQEKARFSRFYNLPELMSLFKEIADIKTPDMLNLDIPQTEFVVEKCPASPVQKAIVNNLAKRADDIRERKVSRDEDNMLNITRQGRAVALDARILNEAAADFADSKVNKCVKNVLDIYTETKAARSTQIIFCDQSTPSSKKSFNVYDDIKQKLIANGISSDEIAFIHDAKNDSAKEKLFEKVRSGDVRILIGSTDMLGVGTNVQDKLIATHDLDVPWRPADLEQRRGRIARRGNENSNIKVFRYVTEGTFDAYMWQIIENKQKFISQIMTSKTPSRVSDEVDELVLSAAEIKAIATGNPLIKEKMEVDNALARIGIARNKFYSDKDILKKRINTDLPRAIAQKEIKIQNLMQDKIIIENNALAKDKDGNEIFSMELNGKIYTDKAEVSEAFSKALKDNYHKITGRYKGLRLNISVDFMTSEYVACFCGKVSHNIPLATYKHTSKTLNFKEMEKIADNIAKEIHFNNQELTQFNSNLQAAQEEINKPFSEEAEFKKLSNRAIELELQINAIEKEKIESIERGENEWKNEDEAGYAL